MKWNRTLKTYLHPLCSLQYDFQQAGHGNSLSVYLPMSVILFSHGKKLFLPFVKTYMELECITVSEIKQTKKEILHHLTYIWDLKKAELIETVEWWWPGPEGWGKWGDVGQRVQICSYKRNNSGSLMYSLMSIVNNTLLYSWKFLKVDLKGSKIPPPIQW